MQKYCKCLFAAVTIFIIMFMSTGYADVGESALKIENTADNPRLVNLSPEQFRCLDVIEKRVYGKSYWDANPVDRVERLEADLFDEVQKGSISQRIRTLRLESTKIALSGTAMTPMMQDTFNTKYINPRGETKYRDDVGIIDGLIRVWWPNFYDMLTEYRKYKEANFW